MIQFITGQEIQGIPDPSWYNNARYYFLRRHRGKVWYAVISNGPTEVCSYEVYDTNNLTSVYALSNRLPIMTILPLYVKCRNVIES